MSTIDNLAEFKDTFKDFATKPSSIIYVGIIILLGISEWQKPTNWLGVTYKVSVLIVSFIIVTVFNSQYFKRYWRRYNK